MRPEEIEARKMRPEELEAKKMRPVKSEAKKMRPEKSEANKMRPKKIEAMSICEAQLHYNQTKLILRRPITIISLQMSLFLLLFCQIKCLHVEQL